MSTDPKAPGSPTPAALRDSFSGCAVRLGELVLARGAAALAPLDLTPVAYHAMLCILEGEGLSQQELSRQLNMYAQKMVGVIDGLEARGLVARTVSPTDRRRHRLHLTPAGSALVARASAVAAALEAELFGRIPEPDKARFRALVERLEAAGG